jgi:hypothetical protein
MPSRTNRFQSFTPLRSSTTSLRRLRTALSPSRSSRSSSASSTTSPLTRNSSPNSSIREMLSVRRKASVYEFELEEERHLFSHELELLEPRPIGKSGGEGHVVGIFEVLDGKC